MIFYKKVGEGRPVIILHGLFGTGDNWRTFAGMLKDQYEIILVDLRNHGRSFWSDDFDYQIAAQDVVQLMDELEIQQADVIGHSMGGKVAMTLAQEYPDRIDKLIVIDIAQKKYPRGHDAIFEAIFSIEPAQLKDRKEAEDKLVLKIKDQGVRQFLLKSLARDKEGGFRWKTNFKALYSSYEAILSEVDVLDIKAKTLFIRGSKSHYISEEEASKLSDHLSEAEVSVVTIEAGHWVHAERPKELFDQVSSFLG